MKTPEQWGVLARRLHSSQLGGATAWCKGKDGLLLFATEEEARRKADEYNAKTVSRNISYLAARYR
jgi:hypothetical protein